MPQWGTDIVCLRLHNVAMRE